MGRETSPSLPNAIRRYLPDHEVMYMQGRVNDLKGKTVEQLKKLRNIGMKEISLGV